MSIDTFNKNLTFAETGTVFYGTTTSIVSSIATANTATYAPYGNNNLSANFIDISTNTVYVKFVPGVVNDPLYAVVKFKVHTPFQEPSQYLDPGYISTLTNLLGGYTTTATLNASDYFNSEVYNSGQIYLQSYAWLTTSSYIANNPPAYTGTAIVSRFSSKDNNLLPSNFEGIRYYTATNTTVNLTAQTTSTGSISIAYDYSQPLQEISKSLGVLAENSAQFLEKMTILLDIVRREGVHTVGQYDWVQMIPILDLLNSKGGTYSTTVFDQDKSIDTLNTLSNYYNAIKSNITKEF